MDTNPTLKFKSLPKAEVLEKLNNMAIDAQWDFTNAKSPKGQRDAEERLNLYGSAVELLKNPLAQGFLGLFTDCSNIKNQSNAESGQ